MKKRILTLILAAAVFVLFSGCASLLEALFKETVSSPPVAVSSDPLDGYVFAYVDGLAGGYHVAKILQPASAATRNQAEVMDLASGGGKRWAEVFTSHPAEKSELAVGEVVLHQGSGFSDPDVETLRATTWTAYHVTDVSDLFKGEIMVGTITVPIKHLRIPDTDIFVE